MLLTSACFFAAISFFMFCAQAALIKKTDNKKQKAGFVCDAINVFIIKGLCKYNDKFLSMFYGNGFNNLRQISYLYINIAPSIISFFPCLLISRYIAPRGRDIISVEYP